MAAITSLTIHNGNGSVPQGYVKIDKDLNKGAKGSTLYLCYSTAQDLGPPITGIQVAASKENARDDDSVKPPGYTMIQTDLNEGARGKYVYLSYITGTSAGPITSVDVITGQQRNIWPGDQYVRVNQDCNEEAGGLFIYIVYKH